MLEQFKQGRFPPVSSSQVCSSSRYPPGQGKPNTDLPSTSGCRQHPSDKVIRTGTHDARQSSETASPPTCLKQRAKTREPDHHGRAEPFWGASSTALCPQSHVHGEALPVWASFGKQKARGTSRRRCRKSLWLRCLDNTVGGRSPDSPLLTRDPVLEMNESLPKPSQQLFKLKLQSSFSRSGESSADFRGAACRLLALGGAVSVVEPT